MKRTILYQYLGTNGTITSPVHLEDVYYVRKIKLMADAGMLLTNGVSYKNIVIVPEEDEMNWVEVVNNGQI